jgi:hypothetical protein
MSIVREACTVRARQRTNGIGAIVCTTLRLWSCTRYREGGTAGWKRDSQAGNFFGSSGLVRRDHLEDF